MVTFGDLDQKTAVKTLADASLLQLYHRANMFMMGTTDYNDTQLFEKGQTTSVMRVKDSGEAEDYDPRSGSDATTSEPGFLLGELTLDRLFTKGYPTYSSDADVATYIEGYTESSVGGIRKSFDKYLYNRGFLDWSGIPTSGTVNLGYHPPLAIVVKENSSGVIQPFDSTHLTSAGKVLDKNDVPDEGRCARIGAGAKADFFDSATLVTGFAGAMATPNPGSNLIGQGWNFNQYVYRYGHEIAYNNVIQSQTQVADTGDGAATDGIAAVAADTTVFFEGDQATSTPAGAVRLTIDSTANLTADVAIGKIARLGPDAGEATAYGVILRVDAANKYVWLIPYSPTGDKLTAAQIDTSTDKFGIPAIGEINVSAHKQHLIFATRLLQEPSLGDGAIAQRAVDPRTGLVMQVFRGSYNIHQFKGGIRPAMLCGAKPTDWRKGVLMLSR